MKTWNIPELQELDVRLTASGGDASLEETDEVTTETESDNSATTFGLGHGHGHGGGGGHRHDPWGSGCRHDKDTVEKEGRCSHGVPVSGKVGPS